MLTARARPGGRVHDPGNRRAYGPHKAEGGRIGYREGEFVEDINVEGPGFDENVMMASDENNTRTFRKLI